ncbi:MAG: hypothetical protein ACJ73D_10110 [Pyrinomonadaceae bacterium]
MSRLGLTTTLLFIFVASCAMARAQCREAGGIQFARGKTSGTVNGTVSAGKAICYKFRVSAEQAVKVVLRSPNHDVRFGLSPDAFDADEVASDTADWEGVIKGKYVISVHVAKGSDTFTLVVTISPGDLTGANAPADDANGLDPTSVAADGATPKDFAPAGWKVGQTAKGDLNGDGQADLVVNLVTDDTPDDRSGTDSAPSGQALLILLADHGKLRRAALNTQFLATESPQYSLDLAIKNGVLTVKEDYGMSDVVVNTIRFRLDPASHRFLMTGQDREFYTRPLTGDTRKTSDNYLTGIRLTTVGHFRNGAIARETTTQERLTGKKVYFEGVK